ncbi:MAG TPA: TIGR02221 family CRISPR-associated protein, partial [Arcobacter sp.]|nr:TIGR02221 family CRISPR-associated protein [Arcobacter sp.]
MAKILISSLGTGWNVKDSDSEYQATNYIIEGKEYKDESFISKSLIEHYNIDKVILLGTNKSMWDGAYLGFTNDRIDDSWETLNSGKLGEGITLDNLKIMEQVLDDYMGKSGSLCLMVNYGQNEDEMWENFEIMYEINQYISEGDEVYLDITHAFRSLPILLFIVMEFMHMMREDFKLSGLLYGMLSNDKSPVIDLKIFFELLDWAKAVNNFKKHANATQLVDLMKESDIDKEVRKTFDNLNQNIRIANMASLWQFIKNAHKKIKYINQSNNKIVKLLSQDVLDMIEKLNKDKMSDFQYELALWFYDNKNYALSYMALGEAIITKTAELKLSDEDSTDKDVREEAKRRIDSPYDKYYWHYKEKDTISEIRNNIAHQLP